MLERDIFDITGKVAIVTGGTRGLGRAFCEILAKYGADVVCTGRDRGSLDETVEAVHAYGRRVLPLTADMTKADTVEKMAADTVAAFGRIDILVANAGVTTAWMRIDEETIEDWDRTINTNLRGQFLSMRAVLPTMMKQRSGSIINISSVGALGGGEVAPASYGASKAGIIALCKHAATQYGRFGIRVNCILPGLHVTDLGMPEDETAREERLQMMCETAAKFFPLGRVAYPHELEGLVALLASDASSYITGATFIQDGGITAAV
jgi:NAD(P)-dependent dehydrogenase (short-subunit alcohol dehydrogenase family)